MADIRIAESGVTGRSADESVCLPLSVQDKSAPRAGWAQDSLFIAESSDDKLVWPEFDNEG